MIDWLSNNWTQCLMVIGGVISGASVAVKVIAPLTKWTGDDKVAAGRDNPRSSLLQPLSFEPQFRAVKLPTKTRR